MAEVRGPADRSDLLHTNAFDTLNIQNVSVGQPGLGVESADYGPPRMFGFRVRYAFGG
jgi:hypothetical protein